MSIPSDIRPLVNELYQVLDDSERQATKGLFALRTAMSLFPENEILMQYFSSISNFQFCVAGTRLQAENIVNNILLVDVPDEDVQKAGDYLATLLHIAPKVKIMIDKVVERLEEALP
ncbi:hypothetical protein [Tychonema sp. LEGE 07203]|uniref:hypothetical protein n=1 Tax=Tychonema sp. LEGE 07203 TaxID=1828671 RepID=UPI00187E61BA|nr:hypothetical protein [Tychonema sp. LEGE 07203]MBE9094589.1 hypothetical protein [Tychonema sp. LEGE 07203]